MRYNNNTDDKMLRAWNKAMTWGGRPFESRREKRKELWHRIKDMLADDKAVGDAVWKWFRENYNNNFYIYTEAIPSLGAKFTKELAQ